MFVSYTKWHLKVKEGSKKVEQIWTKRKAGDVWMEGSFWIFIDRPSKGGGGWGEGGMHRGGKHRGLKWYTMTINMQKKRTMKQAIGQ